MIDSTNTELVQKDSKLKIAMYLLIATMPIELIELRGIYTIPKILGFAALVLFMISMLSKKLYFDSASKYFLVFIYYCVLSLFWSRFPDSSIQKLFTILQIFILYVIIINEIDSKQSLNNVMVLSIIGGAILGISGLIELRQNENIFRMSGITKNANIYFIMAIFLIPSIYWSIKYSQKLLFKLLSIIVMCILFYTSMYTKSIGGIISLSIFFIFYNLFSDKKFFMFIGTLIIFILIIYIAPQGYWQRFHEIGESSTDRFVVLWPAGWRAFMSNVFIGHGIGTSSHILPNYIPHLTFHNISAHNGLLAIGIDLGIIGIMLYLLIIAVPTVHLYKLCRLKRDELRTDLENFGIILFCVLIAYLASWFKSGGFEYFKYLWVLVGLETCVANMIEREKKCLV